MEKNILFKKAQQYPLVVALITQVFVLFFLRNFFLLAQIHATLFGFIFWQGLLSALLCHFVLKLPRWFMVISFLFPLFIGVAWSYLHVSSGLYGVAFILLALTFSHTLKERVPLYLSNDTTHQALGSLIKEHKVKKALDLGSGMGGVVRALSITGVDSHGVESAPLLWLLSSLWSKITRKGVIHRQNIWQTDLGGYGMVYAFLSPAIMERLFQKVRHEMPYGSLFISNSFAVPGVEPTETMILGDKRQTKLYVYRR